MDHRVVRGLAAFGVAAVLLGGCAGNEPEAGVTPPPPQAAESTPAATAPATDPASPANDRSTPAADGETADVAALAFTAPALGGGEIDGRDFAGQDVVLWLWAPW